MVSCSSQSPLSGAFQCLFHLNRPSDISLTNSNRCVRTRTHGCSRGQRATASPLPIKRRIRKCGLDCMSRIGPRKRRRVYALDPLGQISRTSKFQSATPHFQCTGSRVNRRMSSLFCSMPMAIHQFAGLSSIKPDVSKDRLRVVPSSIRLSCCYMKPLGLSMRQERLQMLLAAMVVETG